jgi:hypothetical protein
MLRENKLFEKLGRNILNNYGTPSIYNEFAWAFDPSLAYEPTKFIEEILPGRFADLHMTSNTKADSYEDVWARRLAIIEATKKAAECRVIIMTLGLVEVWWDTIGKVYLNDKPRPSSIRQSPTRFELHVLSFEETLGYLDKAIRLLKKHGRPELQVLVTVSPVPLTVTHRAADVMVANCYSKSVLRAAAESVVQSYDFVHYFPSYESVTLSERAHAWEDDLVHVKSPMVDTIISRFVETLAGPEEMDVSHGASLLEQIDQQANAPQRVVGLIGKDNPALLTDSELAQRYCNATFQLREYDEVRRIGELFPAVLEIATSVAKAELAIGNPENTISILSANAEWTARPAVLALLIKAHLALKQKEKAGALLLRWTEIQKRSSLPYAVMARGLKDSGDIAGARQYYEEFLARDQEDVYVILEYVRVLIELGESSKASDVLAKTRPIGVKQQREYNQLMSIVPRA